MAEIIYTPLPTDAVRTFQSGGPDAHGHPPEKHISEGDGLPCRHCLNFIDEGDEFLILNYKPFESANPYAEQGPIFLHAKSCPAYSRNTVKPEIYSDEGVILLRGYDQNERIVYGTGQVVSNDDIASTAKEILATEGVTYVHARSASNNCFQFRIDTQAV
jgi:Protein of unknown function (DUF1203)